MHIIHSSHFGKRLRRVPLQIRRALIERLRIFEANPQHPLLNDHALSGELHDKRRVSLTGDWGLIYRRIDDETILLLEVGTHHDLYGT